MKDNSLRIEQHKAIIGRPTHWRGEPMNLRNGIIAGAFALLAVVAAAGWTRRAPSTAVQPYALNATNSGNTQPASNYAEPQPVNNPVNNNVSPAYGTQSE